ncbi:MAG: histidinol-phosphatase HisJ family protein [Firmicutes bacterium]|nr:histidinol-phosphatase HisJ family protein [Bacillota bacterium]
MIADYHLHSRFSADSSEEPRRIIERAAALGMRSLCFTDHQDFDYAYDELDFTLDYDAYFKTLSALREEYSGKIDVRIGVETGLEPHLSARLGEFVKKRPYDFVIGSTHLINGVDPYYPEYFAGVTDREAFLRYFDYALESFKTCADFDVYGHLDYIVRYAPEKDKNYSYAAFSDVIDEILKTLIESGKGIELNTGGLTRGMANPNPCPEVVARYRELGGEIITVGSDAHKSEDIGAEFDLARDILLRSGFEYYTVFKDRKPEFIKL